MPKYVRVAITVGLAVGCYWAGWLVWQNAKVVDLTFAVVVCGLQLAGAGFAMLAGAYLTDRA